MPDRYLVEIPWGNAQAVGIELDAVLLRSKLMHKSEEPVAEGNRPVFTAFPRPAPYIQRKSPRRKLSSSCSRRSSLLKVPENSILAMSIHRFMPLKAVHGIILFFESVSQIYGKYGIICS